MRKLDFARRGVLRIPVRGDRLRDAQRLPPHEEDAARPNNGSTSRASPARVMPGRFGDEADTCRPASGCGLHIGMVRGKTDCEQACEEQDIADAATTNPCLVGLAVLFGSFVQADPQTGT